MANVRAVERDQQWLMPPSVSEWLPPDHLAFFILDVVAELDLSAFYQDLRADGRGGASYDPGMVLAVLFYAYCVGERSSRRIERRLTEDVAFRVVAGNQQPDHATLARFRRRHQEAIAEVFSQVLGLCAREGLVSSGVVAIDSTKVEAAVSLRQNRTRRQIAQEILEEAEATDAGEEERFGDRRGDELPLRWADRRDRRARLREALRQLDAEGAADWESYLAERAEKEAALGHKLPGRKPDPDAKYRERGKERQANVTDPDSRLLKDGKRFVQGYSAHAAVTENQVVVAAEVATAAKDATQFRVVVSATEQNIAQAEAEPVGTFVADAGYWSADNAALETEASVLIGPVRATGGITDPTDPRLLGRKAILERLERGELRLAEAAAEMGVSKTWARKLLAAHRRQAPEPAQARAEMEERLRTEAGATAYAKRKTTVEPVFGNLKANLGFRRFSRRGLEAARSEWRLICSVHNLMKLHRHQLRMLLAA